MARFTVEQGVNTRFWGIAMYAITVQIAANSEVYNKLKELDAINSYIYSYYDTLHSQGKEYIVDSLLEYIYYCDPQWLPEGYKPFNPLNEMEERSCLRYFLALS